MTALKAHEVARFLAHPDLDAGVFLAYGPDTGLVHETALRLVQYFSKNDLNADGVITLEGNDVDSNPSILAVEAKTISLFGGKRIIRVRNSTKGLISVLTDICEGPAGTVVILEAGNLLPKDALRTFVEGIKLGRALPCYPDTDETLTNLFRDTFAKQGIGVDAEVIQTLREILGNDREITRRELEKLSLYAAESKRLTRDDVLLLCADNGATVIDAIVDAVGTGHSEKLELALNRALNSGVDNQRLLRAAALHFGALRGWRTQFDSGKSARDVLASARPKPHFSRANAMEQQLRLWPDFALAAACERLQQATLETRRRPALAESVLRRTLVALCMTAAAH